jgi:radical SAM superfamily enzyme YgiQ (UPF0313 family)
MQYEGRIFRPPSEANSFILQATIGCSWNHCTYCDMYRDKTFRVRELAATLRDIDEASEEGAQFIDKVFVADGDALVMPMELWRPILERIREKLPLVRRVSAYAMATNLLAKSRAELEELARLGLSLLYVGPESGDDVTLKRIAKGSTKQQHIEAAALARASGMQLSVIALLGIASERSQQHAEETADLVTQMDPAFFSALTVTVVPNTPLATLQAKGRFAVPPQDQLLRELATMIDLARPTSAVFRTNHASNYLPLAGRLPDDRAKLLSLCEQALQGRIRLRPEWARGL